MAIFHYTVKIVGRSKGKSIISASAYLNGDVMKNEETGRISYYTSKREVVYTSLMMCENAPQEWQNVPAENIKRFQKSVRYKRADNKEVVLEKFKLTFQKQCLWNEVLKIEKSSDAQLGRSFEFSLPKEWNRQEQIEYTTDYIQKNFVDKGMCADWSIHDKGDGNPHVHLLVTMRPFNPDHSWGNKEVKDWEFVRDTDGNIVVDEAHHSSANTYQKVMNYFTPKLWLGMTATPDKRDDDIEEKNIYQIFNYQIAYEIRLQQAMEENMLCPFHYFGITDVSLLGDKEIKSKKLTEASFNQLVGDERVKHIIEQANYFGHSGDRVKGLIFCSRIDESVELSNKFNQTINPETGRFFRTIALNGEATEEERQRAFERLAMDENMLDTANQSNAKQIFDTEGKIQPLDYIFSVEILNEGVDIVEVNQVIMLRPTESPIVFIQQLGRGLRKANGKEYVVILDFIGNYNNNFMIPVALSGDRSYNADTIRKYVISGNNTIPGASTVHFDEIAKDRIFASIDKIKGMKSIIRESYVSLKNRLGRVPYLLDFYENGEVDPLVIIKEYKTYQAFLEAVEKELYIGRLNEQEKTTLEYLSKTILSGARPFELEILRQLMKKPSISINEIREIFIRRYDYKVNMQSIDNAADVLQGKFVSKDDEYKRFCRIDILEEDSNNIFHRMNNFTTRLQNEEFKKQIDDIIEVGLKRYHDKYQSSLKNESPFVLYEKYSRRDVSLLMNCGRDLSSTMYGMKRIDDDVFIFVTYHKEESTDEQKSYVDGKPDYADAFEDNMIFRWDSQIGRGVDSSYVSDVVNTKRKHLLVKKSDAESNFYYMGEFDIVDVCAARKRDNNGKERDITKFEMKMHHPVREDLLRYLQSNLQQRLQNNTQELKAI